jgi:D-threo-aldose 1-dehydrogenase
MPTAHECVPLGRTDAIVSRMGCGGMAFGNLYRVMSEQELERTFDKAWELGLRYFDTAPQYGGGLSEQRLGRFLATRPRGDYTLSTKVGKLLAPAADGRAPEGMFAHGLPFEIHYDYSHDGTMRSIESSLERLGLDRLDIVYIHDVNRKYHGQAMWDRYAEARDGACEALRKLREQGVISAFGPGTREIDVNLRFLDETDIDCIMLPARYTLLDQSADEELLPLCRDKGVAVVLAGPFDTGVLATGPINEATYAHGRADPKVLDRVRRLQQRCADAGVELPAAALQFPLRHPAIASVVVGMAAPEEVEANVRGMAAPIPESLWDGLDDLMDEA